MRKPMVGPGLLAPLGHAYTGPMEGTVPGFNEGHWASGYCHYEHTLGADAVAMMCDDYVHGSGNAATRQRVGSGGSEPLRGDSKFSCLVGILLFASRHPSKSSGVPRLQLHSPLKVCLNLSTFNPLGHFG